jgi:hypothetical protein
MCKIHKQNQVFTDFYRCGRVLGSGARRGALAMTDKTDKIEMALKPKALPLPRRPSYERTVEDIEKWANSSGLQKPVRQ